jgi:hypothetical protein
MISLVCSIARFASAKGTERLPEDATPIRRDAKFDAPLCRLVSTGVVVK